MAASTTTPQSAALMPYMRALWPHMPTPQELPASDAPESQRAVLALPTAAAPAALHLPMHWQHAAHAELQRAAAAHACAHLAHGGPPMERGRLKPIQLALLGVLEDARVEALALRELPGLRTLWLRWHRADSSSGHTFEALLQRLARSLLDPHHHDPHPWVHKARELFEAHAHTPDELRRAASLLGNELGQMRLPFNARLYVVEPLYRDDNQHLWHQDPAALTPQDAAATHADAAQSLAHGAPPEPPRTRTSARYPEWDRLIQRYRPLWCWVEDSAAPAAAPQAWLQRAAPYTPRLDRLSTGWARRLGTGARAPSIRRRQADGDRLCPDALVNAGLQRRLRQAAPHDPRIYLAPPHCRSCSQVLLLIDSSASTDRPLGQATELDLLRAAAWRLALALEAAGHQCAIQAFASNTRQAVHVQHVKAFTQSAQDPGWLSGLAGLRSAWSTRLGAALRHAVSQLAARQALGPCRVLILSDAQAHDVDVHDASYLPHDFRRACREAARAGVAVQCLDVAAAVGAGQACATAQAAQGDFPTLIKASWQAPK